MLQIQFCKSDMEKHFHSMFRIELPIIWSRNIVQNCASFFQSIFKLSILFWKQP